MDGIEKIIQRIAEDAAEELTAIERGGQKKAAAIQEGYQKQADTVYQALVEKGQFSAAERMERLRSVAELEARKRLLAEKQAGIDTAFAQARALLAQLPAAEKTRLYARLAVEAASSGDEEVVLNPADRQAIGPAVVAAANQLRSQAAFRLSADSAEIEGGLILRSPRLDVNCSFDTLLLGLRESMAAQIGALLYE